MSEKQKFWKTTIEIITDYDPVSSEIEDLAREASSGDAYCIGQEVVEVSPDNLDESVVDFFCIFDEDEDEDSNNNVNY